MENQNVREAEVVDLGVFKQKKLHEETLTRGKAAAPTDIASNEDPDYAERVGRIKNSLDRINNLMTELKKMSSQQDKR